MRIVPKLGFMIGGLALLLGVYPLDEGEYHCEEAVKHLQDCCPDRELTISCYAGRGCDHSQPAFVGGDALRLRDASCSEVVAQGWCERPPYSEVPDLAEAPFSIDLEAAPLDASAPRDLGRDLQSVGSDGGDQPDLAEVD